MRFTQALIVVLFCGLLSGCGHNITLMARDSGEIGTGRAPFAWGNSGELTIELKGDTYKGRWVYAAGGSFGLLNTYGTNPTTGTVIGVSGSGIGNALLRSVSGKSLRCEFKYSEWTATGLGVCQNGDGKLYDMQID